MSLTTRKANIWLWIAQAILAALFLFAGTSKLVASPAALAQMKPFSASFLKFIGVCELAGGLGLILPGVFRVRQQLTSLAATGLTIIMIGAVISTLFMMGPAMAIIPGAVGTVTAIVARCRWQPAGSTREATRLVVQLHSAGER